MTKSSGNKRESFASQFGLIMVAVGSAVGLGNIWRFSYILGIDGGGAFLLVYLLCVLLVGVPVLLSEISIGRKSGLSTFSAYKTMAPKQAWWVTGVIAVLASTLITAYYPVVAGWALGYVFESLFDWTKLTADTGAAFTAFSSGWKAGLFAAIALALTVVVLLRGISGGIEKFTKVLMPVLAVMLIILVIRSLTLPGAGAGVAFLFVPDFSNMSVHGFLDALGHQFFSLSVGMGIMITYASYMPKKADLVQAAGWVVTLDTVVALLAGLAIFPAVFALGFKPNQGAGLAFITLPAAFAHMFGGRFFSAVFFLLLFIAAFTSIMSLLQVPLAFLEDEFHLKKGKAMLISCVVIVILGIPSVLAFGPLANFKILGLDYFDFLDRFANNILVPISALLGTMFVIFHFTVAASKKELAEGSAHAKGLLLRIYPIAIKFIAPIAIILILLDAAGVFKLLGLKL
jgi:NSS family neurotransmitter:Na+ symporter